MPKRGKDQGHSRESEQKVGDKMEGIDTTPTTSPVMNEGVLKQAGMKLRFFRRRMGLTQTQLASASDITVRHFQRIESGNLNATIETYMRLCNTLGITLPVLFSPVTFDSNDSKLSKIYGDFNMPQEFLDHGGIEILQRLQELVKDRSTRNSLRASRYLSRETTRSFNDDGIATGIIVKGRMYIDEYATEFGNYESNTFSFGKHFVDFGLGTSIVEGIESIDNESTILIKTKIKIPIGEIPIVACFQRGSPTEVIVAFRYLTEDEPII